MRLSVAVMAHPARRHLVADLIDRVDIDSDRVVWDRHDDVWETGVRAWQHHDPAADWHLVLQDDALPCRNLLSGVETMLAELPIESVASLYLSNNGKWVRIGTHHAEVRGEHWIQFARLIWGVAIAIPVATIGDMLAWTAEHPQPGYDTRIARYYERALRWPAYYTWPSLVDHRQGPSLLDHPDGRKALRFIGEDISALERKEIDHG